MTPITTFFIITFSCVVMLILVMVGGHTARVKQRKLALAAEREKTPSLPPVPPRYSAKDIRNIRIGSLLLIPLWMFMILIPFSCTWWAEIPPFEQLQMTSGELTYQDVGKRGDRLTGIKSESSTIFFTCAEGKFFHPDCLFPMAEYEKLSGKPATVWWYEQPVYLFSTQKRLVRMVVAGEEKMSYEKTVRFTAIGAKWAVRVIFVVLVLFISIVIGFERMIRRQEHEQRNG